MDIHKYIKDNHYGYDKKDGKFGLFKYYDFEKTFINHIMDNRFSLLVKSRQMHITTLLSYYSAWFLLNNTDVKNEIIYFGPNKIGGHFKDITLNNLIHNNNSVKFKRNNSKELRVKNNSLRIETTRNCETMNFDNVHTIIVDEAVFVDKFDVLSKMIEGYTTNRLNNVKRVIISSTPKDMDPFYKLFENSKRGCNDFKLLEFSYKDNPNFNNKTWYESMCKYYDLETINNEILGKFNGWKPKPNKNVTLQVRVDEELVNDMFTMMQRYHISSKSDYIRKLIINDISSLEYE